MRNFLIVFFLLCFFVNIYATDTQYVTVSFTPSKTPTHWAQTSQDLYSQSSSTSSTNSDSWGQINSSSYLTLLEDRDNSGGISTYDWVRETTVTSQSGTRTTTTTTKTTTTTASAVDIFFTIWDIVDAGTTFSLTDEELDKRENWNQKWTKKTTAKDTKSNTFQIRKDTEAKVKEDVTALNTLYNNEFQLEEQIENLVAQIEAYRSNPQQDKQHTAMMSELVKLRKDLKNLRKDTVQKYRDVFSEKGTDLLGWTLNTNVSTSVANTNTDLSWSTSSSTEHNICFVASTLLSEGCTIENAWKENISLEAGKVVRSDYYQGLVYMLYDASGRKLLPGAVTYNHLILTTDILQKKRACDIQKGDRLICGSNEIVTVDRIEIAPYQGYVYNIGNNYDLFSFHPDYVLTVGIADKD